MRRLVEPSARAASLLLASAALFLTAPAAAIPVVGQFTAEVFEIVPFPESAEPFFVVGDPVVGSFGYDTDAASDSDPGSEFGTYQFTDTAFVSITVRGATYTTDVTLSPIIVSLGTGPGNPGFRIRGGLVPQAQVPLATGDVPLELLLINPASDFVFLPNDALPTSTFGISGFNDRIVQFGRGGTTPYGVLMGLRSLSVASVPEPDGAPLLLLGLAALGLRRRRRLRAARRVSVALLGRPCPACG